jgi:hypothetical protein
MENVMKISRREFSLSSFGMLLVAMTASLWSAACAAFDNIVKWVGVGIAGVSSVVALLAGAGIGTTAEGVLISLVLKAIKAGFADVQAAIAEYENAPAADKATAKGRISTALQALADQIQKFWSDLSIPDARLGALIQGLLGIVLTAIAGFMTQLPAPVTPSTAVNLPRRINVAPRKMSESEFRNEFNGLLSQAGYSGYTI